MNNAQVARTCDDSNICPQIHDMSCVKSWSLITLSFSVNWTQQLTPEDQNMAEMTVCGFGVG